MQNFQKQRDFHGLISIKYENGICSILHKLNFCTKLVQKLQKVDNATTPMPDLLQFVPWRHQTVIVSKCTTINAALFYLNKVIEDNMSRTELEHVIKAQLYEHTGKA